MIQKAENGQLNIAHKY